MCGVLHRNLGKGARCALPLHPSGLGSSTGIEPIQSHQNVSPFHHSRETSLSLHPSIKGAIAPLVKSTRQGNGTRHVPIRGAFLLPRYPHDHFMETKDGSFRATLPWNLPIDQRAFEASEHLTNVCETVDAHMHAMSLRRIQLDRTAVPHGRPPMMPLD